jgi:hypothetical protein
MKAELEELLRKANIAEADVQAVVKIWLSDLPGTRELIMKAANVGGLIGVNKTPIAAQAPAQPRGPRRIAFGRRLMRDEEDRMIVDRVNRFLG